MKRPILDKRSIRAISRTQTDEMETLTCGKTNFCIGYQVLPRVRYQTQGTPFENETQVRTLTRQSLLTLFYYPERLFD